jgi:hypothetical protein
MKTSELTGAALDWAVTKCEGFDHKVTSSEWGMWGWATDWAQGGPLIEREGIRIVEVAGDVWGAVYSRGDVGREHFAETPLIAAMRCYWCAKLGDEIDIPEELCHQQNS